MVRLASIAGVLRRSYDSELPRIVLRELILGLKEIVEEADPKSKNINFM